MPWPVRSSVPRPITKPSKIAIEFREVDELKQIVWSQTWWKAFNNANVTKD